MNKIKIIGSGLAGPLLAILLAQKGFKIDLFEKRDDFRKSKNSAGRSINLALSHRGIKALKKAKLFDMVESHLIPMKGRLIHDLNGQLNFQPYSINSIDCIFSVSRSELNKILITSAEKVKNIRINFNHTLKSMNDNFLYFQDNKTIENEGIIIAADGVNSKVRNYIDQKNDISSKLEPLNHSYKELTIKSNKNNQYLIDSKSLHIWPRGQFMIIALPNTDKSFTCTLFMPNNGENSFESLNTNEKVIFFFNEYFPDLVPILDNFPNSFSNNPTSKLGTIYSKKWNYKNTLIIGDAAHAIVPFFGQGMNASFEDCDILIDYLNSNNNDFLKTFSNFNNDRIADANAIARMALENYVEMRDSVSKNIFIKKKKIENLLYKHFPKKFIPRYNMVSFSSIPYNKVYNKSKIQDKIVDILINEEFEYEAAKKIVNKYL